MQFYERFKNLCFEQGKSPTGVGKEIGVDGSTVNYWKNNHTPKKETLSKIAEYFDVSVDYLIGNTDNRLQSKAFNGDDIAKMALFGGDMDVSDEMWNEAKQFAEYLKHKYNNK